jgi:hypothetical protein
MQGALDISGLSALVLALLPGAGAGELRYFHALFDLDGDGWVRADDIMDAFEEAGTSVPALETPAQKVGEQGRGGGKRGD